MKNFLKGFISLAITSGLLIGCGSVPSYQLPVNTYQLNTQTSNPYIAQGVSKNFVNTNIQTTSEDGLQTLYIQPQAGALPLIEAVRKAQKYVEIQVYMLSMKEMIEELINAAKRGVKVRLILEKEPFNPADPSNPIPINLKTYKMFKDAGVLNNGVWIKWSNKCPWGQECGPTSFSYTHQKSMIIDGNTGFILTMNLSGSAVASNREYLIVDRRPEIVKEMRNIFYADWNNQVYQAPSNTPLVISPVNSRNQLEGLINSAKKYLAVGFEVWGDENIMNLLKNKAQQGVDIEVIFGHYKKVSPNLELAKKLKSFGINKIGFLGSPFMHGKVIVADNTAYIGSVNLTANSMGRNRELGIILKDKKIVNALKESFQTDLTKNCDPMPQEVVASFGSFSKRFIDLVDTDY